MSWTDERADMCSKMWRKGMSASTIADRLGGVTRNAVIGKVYRMGLMVKPKAMTDRDKGFRRHLANESAMLARMRSKKAGGRKSPQLPATEAVDIAPEDAPELVPFMDLQVGQCKWPVDNTWGAAMLCCGAKAELDKPYCPHHTARARGKQPVARAKPSRERR